MKKTENGINTITKGSLPPWMQSESMEYDIESQDRYKNKYINNKKSGKGEKNHSSTIVCSGTSLTAPGFNN